MSCFPPFEQDGWCIKRLQQTETESKKVLTRKSYGIKITNLENNKSSKCKAKEAWIQERLHPQTLRSARKKWAQWALGYCTGFFTIFRVFRALLWIPLLMGSNNANFENKTASYFSSKMGLFETSRIIAVQDKQTIAKSIGNSTKHRDEHYRAKKKKKKEVGSCSEWKSIGRKPELRMVQHFSLAGLVAGPGDVFPVEVCNWGFFLGSVIGVFLLDYVIDLVWWYRRAPSSDSRLHFKWGFLFSHTQATNLGVMLHNKIFIKH